MCGCVWLCVVVVCVVVCVVFGCVCGCVVVSVRCVCVVVCVWLCLLFCVVVVCVCGCVVCVYLFSVTIHVFLCFIMCPSLSSSHPSYISGVHHFWVRFLRMWPFFNPTFKVVTFCLRRWCVLGVFLLPAFTRLGHEHQDLLSPWDEMHVCTD